MLQTVSHCANVRALGVFGLLACLSAVPGRAAASLTVNATDVIYAAGGQTSIASNAGGTVPGAIINLDAQANYVTFGVTGSITLNGGGNSNDADGVGAGTGSSSSTGYGSISGVAAADAGYLVGVFLAAGGASGTAPAALDFTSSGTSFASLSPLIDQAFFIGDGLTGDGSGSVQDFYVPAGATELVLGISDACGCNGSPSCYGDNSGTFTVSDVVSENAPGGPTQIPEPSSLAVFLAAILGFQSSGTPHNVKSRP